MYSFSSLALQATATELLVRLNSRGLAGEVARESFRAALPGYDWSTGQQATIGHRTHFTRATCVVPAQKKQVTVLESNVTSSGDMNPLLQWVSGLDTFILSPQRVANVLIFATDGTMDRDHGAPIGGFASVTPHPLSGLTLNPTKEFFFRGKGVRVVGAEPVAIDSMELLTLVDLLENGPFITTLIYIEASYVLHGASRRRPNARAWFRQSNRSL